MSHVEVILRVPADAEEIAIAHLLEFSPGGFRNDPVPGSGEVEFGIYVEVSQAASVESYLARAGVPVSSAHVSIVPDDWAERWKAFHKAVLIGGLWVGPPWLEHEAPSDHRHVVIEPGQGFGTGAHPTTRMMLDLLQRQPRAGILDVGCGSGVLAVAAAMLGFGPIEAIDNDPAAIDATHDNLRRNGVESSVSVRLVDAVRDRLPRADIVLANLTLEPLRGLAPRLDTPRVVASGLLRSQVDEAEAIFAEQGFVTRERTDRDGWVALVFDTVDVDSQAMRHTTVI